MISVDAEIMPDVHPGESGLGQYTSVSLYRLITLDLSQGGTCFEWAPIYRYMIQGDHKQTQNRENLEKPKWEGSCGNLFKISFTVNEDSRLKISDRKPDRKWGKGWQASQHP